MCDCVFLSFTSNDYKEVFPENTGADFHFKLDKILEFDVNKWEVCLISFHNKNLKINDDFILCLDGVLQSHVGEQKLLPCIGRYPKQASIYTPVIPFRLTRQLFETLHIYINAKSELIKHCKETTSTVQLLFKRVGCAHF